MLTRTRRQRVCHILTPMRLLCLLMVMLGVCLSVCRFELSMKMREACLILKNHLNDDAKAMKSKEVVRGHTSCDFPTASHSSQTWPCQGPQQALVFVLDFTDFM